MTTEPWPSPSFVVMGAEELGRVARLGLALLPDETGPAPGVALSLVDGHRCWTVVTPTLRVSITGGEGLAGWDQPVWLPLRAVLHAAELARRDRISLLRLEATAAGPVVVLDGTGGGARIDLPDRESVAPAVAPGEDLDAVEVSVEAWPLARAVRAATRGPVGLVVGEPVGVVRPLRDGVSVDVDWSGVGAGRSCYRVAGVPSRADGPRVSVDLVPLSRALRTFPRERVLVRLHASGSLSVTGDGCVLITEPHRTGSGTHDAADALAALGAVRLADGRWRVTVEGSHMVIDAAADGYDVRLVVCTGLAVTAAVLEELNTLNRMVTAGRVWVEPTGDLVLGAEVPNSGVAGLASTVRGLAAAAAGLAAFLGGLAAEDPTT